MSDYIDEFRKRKFCEHTRENFYKQARLDIARAKVRGEITIKGDDIYDIISTTRRHKFTEDEKQYIIHSDKSQEDLALELDCSVRAIYLIRRETK